MDRNWQAFFKGKRITVMGLGLLGRGVGDIAFLAKYAKEIIVTDLKDKKALRSSISKLKKFKNIEYTLGKHELKDFENRDFILKAAGVPLESQFIKHARKNKIPVYMSTALFAKFTPAKIIGITGTRGKTTVTHMLFEALKDLYKEGKVFLGGNIKGMSTLAMLPKLKFQDIAVLELDSWQLQGFGDLKLSPHISIFTTFMPDHLNYYSGKLKKYAEDKAKIFNNQKAGDVFILSTQAKKALAKLIKIPKKSIVVTPKEIALSVPGDHNKLNASLAYTALRKLNFNDIQIKRALEKFTGVAGRLEYLGVKGGVKIYNDTTSTTPDATAAALKALGKGKNISLILGGSEKNIDLKVLKPLIKKYCAWVSLFDGTGTQRLIKEKIITSTENSLFKNFKEAIKIAHKKTPKNGVLLLSSGFTSFGMFNNEYHRGEEFNKIIKKMK